MCGLKQEHIQKRLLTESKLDLEKAIQTAVAMETASRDAFELQGKRESNSGKTKPKPPLKPSIQLKCYRCGGDHKTNTCKYTNVSCSYCDKVGYFEKACLNWETPLR